jgi:hypothetical protein
LKVTQTNDLPSSHSGIKSAEAMLSLPIPKGVGKMSNTRIQIKGTQIQPIQDSGQFGMGKLAVVFEPSWTGSLFSLAIVNSDGLHRLAAQPCLLQPGHIETCQ